MFGKYSGQFSICEGVSVKGWPLEATIEVNKIFHAGVAYVLDGFEFWARRVRRRRRQGRDEKNEPARHHSI